MSDVFAERLRRPPARGLERTRLSRRVLAPDAPTLALVLGPAGSGKTTLLSAIAAATPSCWYRTGAEDETEAELVRHLAQAIGAVVPGEQLRTEPAVARVDAFVDDLDRAVSGRPGAETAVTLVVDDVHEISGTPAEKALERFVLRRPEWLRVVLGSRRPPALNVSRLLVSGALVQLDADDLRFRSWEVEELFRDVYAEPLSPSAAAALTRRTGGWAAGLQLFHLATRQLSRVERDLAVADLSGRSTLIRSYLTRNVLDGLPPDRFDFLLRTCTLGNLTGERCDALLGTTGSAEVLADLEQQQLFTVSVDGGLTYRYHQVLQSHLEVVLVDRVGLAAAGALHARSAELLQDRGDIAGAIRCFAHAEQWDRVAQLLPHTPTVLSEDELIWGSRGLRASTPDEPNLALVHARRLLRTGRIAAAIEAYRHAEALLDDPDFRRRCADERATAAVWLPGPASPVGGPRPPSLSRSARVARDLRRATRTLADPEPPGSVLARAVVRLLSGDWVGTESELAAVADEPASSPVERIAARLVGHLAAIQEASAPETDRNGADRLDELTASAEAEGVPWLARLIRCVQAATMLVRDDSTARLTACADLLVECRRQDGWTTLLDCLVIGSAYGRAGRPDLAVAPLLTAHRVAADLDAPVLGVWAEARALAAADACEGEGWGSLPDPEAVRRRALQLGVAGAADLVAAHRAPSTGAVEQRPVVVTDAARVVLRCLGGFSLTVDGHEVGWQALRPRARILLMLLALNHGQDQHRERLLDVLWPGATPASGTRSLQVAVSSVRQCLAAAGLPDSSVQRHGDAYALVLSSADDQLRRFESAATTAQRAAGGSRSAATLRLLGSTVDAYAGELLPEAGPADWAVEERDRLRSLAAGLAASTAELALELDDPAQAVVAARRSVALDPYHDPAWRHLSEAYERTGDPSAAARARRDHARMLVELGVLPTPTTTPNEATARLTREGPRQRAAPVMPG